MDRPDHSREAGPETPTRRRDDGDPSASGDQARRRTASSAVATRNGTRRWGKGARGRRRLARTLAKLTDPAWVVLHDVVVPGTLANIDHLVVGPPGVVVIDTRNFGGERVWVHEGKMSVGGESIDFLPRVRAEAAAVKDLLGSGPFQAPVTSVVAVFCRELAIRAAPPDVRIKDARHLDRWLGALPHALRAGQCLAIADHIRSPRERQPAAEIPVVKASLMPWPQRPPPVVFSAPPPVVEHGDVIEEADVAAIAAAARHLKPPAGQYVETDFVLNLMETVLDYMMQTPVVVKALEHYRNHCWDEVRTIDDLERIFARHPDTKQGNTALALHLWGYKLWTRAGQLRRLTEFFRSVGVTDQDELREWARGSDFARDFKGKVKGLGPAVYQWLVMRQGVDTVKPDIHIRRFAEAAAGHAFDDEELIAVMEQAAARLGMKAFEFDAMLWEAARGGPLPYPSVPEPTPAS